MSPPPRSLTFAVSTSLLTASLALAGCDEPKKQINPGPINEPEKNASGQPPEPEPDHVNVGPEPTTAAPDKAPEEIHVNEGPEPKPTDQPLKVNPGPDGEKPIAEPEPKHVNTRPNEP